MASIISYYVVCFVMGVYYIYKKAEDKRFGASPYNKKIEEVYKKWYRRNGNLLNKEITTIPEINKILYELKTELENKNMGEEHVKSYLEAVKNDKSTSRIGIKDILLGFFGWFTTNSLIQKYSNGLYSSFKEVLKNDENIETIVNILYLILLVGGIISVVIIMSLVATLDNVRRNNQRIFVFEELEKIWGYTINSEITEGNESLDNKTIYTELKWSESNFDKMLKSSLGDDISDNINVAIACCLGVKKWFIKWIMQIFFFILGFVPSLLLYVILVCLYNFTVKLVVNSDGIWKIVLCIIMAIIILLIFIIWLICYNSQIGVFAENEILDDGDSKKYYKRRLTVLSYIQILLYVGIVLGTAHYFIYGCLASIVFCVVMFIGFYVGGRWALRSKH